MARVKRSVHAKKKRRVTLERAKGYYGNKSRSCRAANEQVMHSLQYAYRDRRARKGDFRRLWIQRINAACRQNGISYSRFIAGLRLAGVEVDRKVLADLAVTDEAAFRALAETAAKALEDADAGLQRRPDRSSMAEPDRRPTPQPAATAAPLEAPQCAYRRGRLRHRRADARWPRPSTRASTSRRSSPSRRAPTACSTEAAGRRGHRAPGRRAARWPAPSTRRRPTASRPSPASPPTRRAATPSARPARWRSCWSAWPTPATRARCCARPRPRGPGPWCSATGRSTRSAPSACGRRPGRSCAWPWRGDGDQRRRPRGLCRRTAGAPWRTVGPRRHALRRGRPRRPGRPGARQRGPRPARRRGRGGRRGRDDPDGGPGRVAQRGHGGHGPVLRGAAPAHASPPPPLEQGNRLDADAAAGGRVHDDMTDPTSPSRRRPRRRDRPARGRGPGPHRRRGDARRAARGRDRGARQAVAADRVPQAARRARRRGPAHGRQGAQRGQRRRARRRRRAAGRARGRRPHRAAARPSASTSPRCCPRRRVGHLHLVTQAIAASSRTCSSAWASPWPRAPRSRPTGTTSGRSTSRPATRPATCTTRSTSTLGEPGLDAAAHPHLARCRSG